MLSREDILNADDLPVREVETPEWGEGASVFVRTLSAAEREAMTDFPLYRRGLDARTESVELARGEADLGGGELPASLLAPELFQVDQQPESTVPKTTADTDAPTTSDTRLPFRVVDERTGTTPTPDRTSAGVDEPDAPVPVAGANGTDPAVTDVRVVFATVAGAATATENFSVVID